MGHLSHTDVLDDPPAASHPGMNGMTNCKGVNMMDLHQLNLYPQTLLKASERVGVGVFGECD